MLYNIFGYKARQDVPPGVPERVIRIHVTQTRMTSIVQITEPEPGGHRRAPHERIMQPYYFFRGDPLSASQIHPHGAAPLCGYAATEGRKARQDAPPGVPERVSRSHATQTRRTPSAQTTEPEPLSQAIGAGSRV